MSWALLLILAGHVYVVDHGLSAEDCGAALETPAAVRVIVDRNGDAVPMPAPYALRCELQLMEE
ncbi:hypothetical protein [Pleomorphomonas sp. PLEO]|uniref:hypothetical protein n=1 Tax=Pleomorphomonas sp. PLEO TaxID=3239306 RepID=UPI00351E95C0